jgi:transcriptional regulator with XRE-family HTH domain
MPIEMKRSSRRSRAPEISIDWKAVGRRIRELRGFDMTQGQFAQRIGVSQGYFSHIERGEKEIGAVVLLKASRAFGKSMEWLLTGEDRK